MSISVVDFNQAPRSHPTGTNFPLSNVGLISTEYVDVVCEFDFESTVNEQVLIVAVNKVRLLGGVWSNKGYVVGDNVSFFGVITSGGTATLTGITLNIIAISGDTMTLSGSLDPTVTNVVVGQTMPLQAGATSNTPMGIFNNTRSNPETVELFHNLIPNTSFSGTGSLFDGEVNKFNFESVGAMVPTDTILGVQQGNKSGGSYISYEIERLADVAATNWTFLPATTNVSYRITLNYANPLSFEDSDFDKPSWFDSNSSIKPFYSFNARSQQNNPNSVLKGTYAGLLGNMGWTDESYNQGVNEFTLVSVTITDASLNSLSEVDFSQSNIITAVITHPSLDFLEAAEIQFSLIPDTDIVKNKPESHADLTQLSNFFIILGGVSSQVFGTGGAEMQTSAESLNVATPNQITVQFTLDPNTAFTSLVDSFDSLSRRYKITANVESVGGTANTNNAVPLTLKQGIMELSPVVGEPYPVREQAFFNHANVVTGIPDAMYRGCTEDDFLYKALFNFTTFDVWNGIELKIQVVRDSDSETFDLVSKFVNLTNTIVTPDGKIQVNYNENITQYLESPDRNALNISLTGNDVGTEYEVQILWSLMASWRYWIAQSNAMFGTSADFFDGALPNNGMNAEWMRYLRLAGYSLRVRVNLIDDNNTAFYFGAGIDLQDYDDTPDITTTTEYYDSSGVLQSSWLSNEIMTIKKIHTLTSGTWDVNDTWGWNSVRPFENEANKRISTEWDWTSQNNPLMPPSGETKATLTFPTPDVAVVECRVNTSMISVQEATSIGRIESPKDPVCISPIDYIFDQVVASSDSPEQYPVALRAFLINGILAKNSCCATCSMLNSSTLLNDEVFIFGSDLLTVNPSLLYDPLVACCLDSYGSTGGSGFPINCNVNFDLEWDNFMITLSGFGDTTALDALIPSQMNSYATASVTLLIAKIQAITTNLTVQYELMSVLLNRGFQVVCESNGDKTISMIPV